MCEFSIYIFFLASVLQSERLGRRATQRHLRIATRALVSKIALCLIFQRAEAAAERPEWGREIPFSVFAGSAGCDPDAKLRGNTNAISQSRYMHSQLLHFSLSLSPHGRGGFSLPIDNLLVLCCFHDSLQHRSVLLIQAIIQVHRVCYNIRYV